MTNPVTVNITVPPPITVTVTTSVGPTGPIGPSGAQGPRGIDGSGVFANAPANPVSFGADPSGIADSTTAIIAAIDAAKGIQSGFHGVEFPEGTFLVQRGAMHLYRLEGFRFRGAGKSVTGGLAGHIPFQRGTRIVIIGTGTGPALRVEGCSSCDIGGFMLRGSPINSGEYDWQNYAPVGIRYQNSPGIGASANIFNGISVANFHTGIDTGIVESGYGSIGNTDNTIFDQIRFTNCITGIYITDNQNVNYSFRCAGAVQCKIVFYLLAGGNLNVDMLDTYDVGHIVQNENGSAGNGTNISKLFCDGGPDSTLPSYQWKGNWFGGSGYHIGDIVEDGPFSYVCISGSVSGNSITDAAHWTFAGGRPTQVWQGKNAATAIGTFKNITFNNQQSIILNRPARFEVNAGNFVYVENGNNMAGNPYYNPTGSGPLMSLSGNRDGYTSARFIGRNLFLPSVTGTVDLSKVLGYIGTDASWKLYDSMPQESFPTGTGFLPSNINGIISGN